MSGSVAAPRYVWRKLSSAKWEDVWPERLSEFADRLAITILRGRKSIKVEVFNLTAKEAAAVRRAFAGVVEAQKRDVNFAARHSRAPILIRGTIAILSDPGQVVEVSPTYRRLVIPAGMAFGTGEHATTLMSLRLLVDFARKRSHGTWDSLDLGCGSGILALAAASLGARHASGFDNDPACVRTSQANAALNGLGQVRFRRSDLGRWSPKTRWDLISANLFSQLLIENAPRICAALKPGGWFIFSGILRQQWDAVISAIVDAGIEIAVTKTQGKWCCGAGRKSA